MAHQRSIAVCGEPFSHHRLHWLSEAKPEKQKAHTNTTEVVIGLDFRIQQFTDSARWLFNLVESDLGGDAGKIGAQIGLPKLDRLILQVILKVRILEQIVQDRNGCLHLLQIQPMQDASGKVSGARMAFMDLPGVRTCYRETWDALACVTAIIETINTPLLILDRHFKIRFANEPFFRTFSLLRTKAEGKELFRLSNGQWDDPNLRLWLQGLVDGSDFVEFCEVHQDIPRVGRKSILLSASPIRVGNRTSGILVRLLDAAHLDTSKFGILALSTNGRILWANTKADDMFGYEPGELITKPLSILTQGRQQSLIRMTDSVNTGNPTSASMLLGQGLIAIRKDGSEFPIEIRLTEVGSSCGVIRLASLVDLGRKQGAKQLEKSGSSKLKSKSRSRELSLMLVTAQEEVRRYLSRELHDDLNQQLALLAMEVDTIANQYADAKKDFRFRLKSLSKHIARVSMTVHDLAYRLHPSILDNLGLELALEELCADFRSQAGLAIEFRKRNLPKRILPEVALCIYRVVQESLLNVAKHAGKPAASVSLHRKRDGLHLVVEDYGEGFDPDSIQRGLGVISIKERLQILNGTVSICTQSGLGTRLEAIIPLASLSEGF